MGTTLLMGQVDTTLPAEQRPTTNFHVMGESARFLQATENANCATICVTE
jgi:hypothetical protein